MAFDREDLLKFMHRPHLWPAVALPMRRNKETGLLIYLNRKYHFYETTAGNVVHRAGDSELPRELIEEGWTV
jgi:hypothetical protein